MAQKTPIEWTETTWNPLTGCTKISPGCKRCYAERLSKRLKAMGSLNGKVAVVTAGGSGIGSAAARS